MNRAEKPLRALQTLVQFDVATVGAEVASAATQRSGAEREVSDWTQRCQSTATELRSATARSPVNPALLGALQKIYRAERRILQESQGRLEEARQKELQARSRLAGLRNTERSLEQALRAERRRRELRTQSQQIVLADDLWLQQQGRRELS